MFDVIAIGSATVDAFVQTDRRFARGKSYSFPIGSKIKIDELKFDTGGGGTNTAVSFSRLGLKTAFLGKVGKGDNARRIFEQLKKEKVDTSLVVSENARTAFSIILDAKGNDRTILTYRGSSQDLGFSEIRMDRFRAKWIYSSALTGKSFESFIKIVEFSSKNGIRVAFNPSLYLIKENKQEIINIIHKINILIFNKEEAEELISSREASRISKGAKNESAYMSRLLKAVYKLGPELVVITDGAKGSWCYDGVHKYEMPCHRVKVVETTGAGDAYASTFVAARIRAQPIESAMQCAMVNAESVIQHVGAKNILLRWHEVMERARKANKVRKIII